MQRSHMLRSSQESATPSPFRAALRAATAASRCAAFWRHRGNRAVGRIHDEPWAAVDGGEALEPVRRPRPGVGPADPGRHLAVLLLPRLVQPRQFGRAEVLKGSPGELGRPLERRVELVLVREGPLNVGITPGGARRRPRGWSLPCPRGPVRPTSPTPPASPSPCRPAPLRRRPRPRPLMRFLPPVCGDLEHRAPSERALHQTRGAGVA